MLTLTRAEFRVEHLDGTEPVLVTDGLADWPARSWSPKYLATAAGAQVVDVAVSLTGSFRFYPDGAALDPANQFLISNVSLRDAADFIMDPSASNPKYYVSQQNVLQKLPGLVAELRFPKVSEPHQINLWFGSAGTITPLHYDASSNLYAQIFGSKTFTIFPPSETQYLYPFPEGTRRENLSHLDLDRPDLERYPLLQAARGHTFTIAPGQLLFLPAFWWHHVKSLSVAISVSHWWAPDAKRFPLARDALRAHATAGTGEPAK